MGGMGGKGCETKRHPPPIPTPVASSEASSRACFHAGDRVSWRSPGLLRADQEDQQRSTRTMKRAVEGNALCRQLAVRHLTCQPRTDQGLWRTGWDMHQARPRRGHEANAMHLGPLMQPPPGCDLPRAR